MARIDANTDATPATLTNMVREAAAVVVESKSTFVVEPALLVPCCEAEAVDPSAVAVVIVAGLELVLPPLTVEALLDEPVGTLVMPFVAVDVVSPPTLAVALNRAETSPH